MEEKEKKVSQVFTIYPSQQDWLREQASKLSLQTGEFVSASEIVTHLIADAQENDARIARILKSIQKAVA